MCNWMYSGGMGSPMVYGGIFMIVFWTLITFTIIYFIRRFTPVRQPQALVILQERFARGEIDAEEYKERRNGLNE